MSREVTTTTGSGEDNLRLLFYTLAARVSIAVWICASLLIAFSLYFASTLLVPLVLSTLAYLAMRPIVHRMSRHRIPQAVTAGVLLLGIVAVIGGGLATIAAPAQAWILAAPENFDRVAEKLRVMTEPLAVVDRAEKKLDALADEGTESAPIEVEVASPSYIDREMVMSSAGRGLAFLVAVGVITFFLLATGDDLLNRLLRILPTFGDRRQAIELIVEIQNAVGRYLGQITLINIGLGVAVSIAMWAVGMPTPLLWGVIATCFNFIPYVGAIAAASIIFFAASIEFEPLWRAVTTTLLFLALTTLEGNFVTPSVLGKTLRLGPVVVLVAVAFWGFMWGILGVFMAVPLLIVTRLICNYFPVTRPIAVLLGEDVMDDESETAEELADTSLVSAHAHVVESATSSRAPAAS